MWRWLPIFLLCLLTLLPAQADSWQTVEALPDVDLSALSTQQAQTVLRLLRDQDCSCQCGMKVAECRIKDPNCTYSKALSKIAVVAVKTGKSNAEIKKALADSPGYKRPKLLEDPVQIATAGAPVQGPDNARITLIEFSDFECPYCSKANANLRAILEAYSGHIRLIYKQFPLSMHPHAELAAAASLAAMEQGKFWEMHDKLFANFHNLNRQNILTWAKETGLDMQKFVADLDSGKYAGRIQKDIKDGEAAGVYGTPAFFINGKHYNGPFELADLKPILDAELKGTPAGQASATK